MAVELKVFHYYLQTIVFCCENFTILFFYFFVVFTLQRSIDL
ncbi:unnamed protein product [Schistosoma curassoni]|uniref:Uncharacterized protein n=1 Tax=Schistosoma curassoni TaxID=6186 RepID=A0A183JMF1_9TREM|nr:unnamed protein product [Schistosoma curassoni]